MPDIRCGPIFEDLVFYRERGIVLKEAEETFRIFYKMVEEILILEESAPGD